MSHLTMIKLLNRFPLGHQSSNYSANLRKVMITATLGVTVALSGCSLFSVYRIDLPQGTPITQTQAQKLQVGMNQNQVLYILGSPAIKDTLAPNRWDYIYDYQAGTEGERKGITDVKNASQHLIVYFDANGIVTRIEGIETLPQS
ncbi:MULTISPECIES: outer membrane protein assembly factor BamE [unclassified Psychrobacter]|uniref:outer membrane protein assembly factor BamE n=2 Tax=Psychrobacter TaxID=497 RepID=UPI0009E77918|nr:MULTISPECIES: outer membrane protein assembly factor BamE [unclassified Psychrobacter]